VPVWAKKWGASHRQRWAKSRNSSAIEQANMKLQMLRPGFALGKKVGCVVAKPKSHQLLISTRVFALEHWHRLLGLVV